MLIRPIIIILPSLHLHLKPAVLSVVRTLLVRNYTPGSWPRFLRPYVYADARSVRLATRSVSGCCVSRCQWFAYFNVIHAFKLCPATRYSYATSTSTLFVLGPVGLRVLVIYCASTATMLYLCSGTVRKHFTARCLNAWPSDGLFVLVPCSLARSDLVVVFLRTSIGLVGSPEN